MHRRTGLITLLALVAATATAQPSRRRPRIGVLPPGTPEFYAPGMAAFREGLAEVGRAEPATLELVFRYSGGSNERLPALARELVAADVDLIVSASTPAIRAAMAATSTISIIFAAVADAGGSGLASLARPGGRRPPEDRARARPDIPRRCSPVTTRWSTIEPGRRSPPHHRHRRPP